MKKLTLVILILTLAACSAGPVSDLERSQKLWNDQGISHYQFTLQIGCFCAFMDQMPLTVEVRDGQIVSMTDSKGTQVLDTDPSYVLFARYATIDNLFVELQDGLNGGADVVTAAYNPSIGHPTEIHFDFIKDAVDDELSVLVTDLQVLK